MKNALKQGRLNINKSVGSLLAGRVRLNDGLVGTVHTLNSDGSYLMNGRRDGKFESNILFNVSDVEKCGNDIQHRCTEDVHFSPMNELN